MKREEAREAATDFHEVRYNNKMLGKDSFAILQNGSAKTILRDRMRFD